MQGSGPIDTGFSSGFFGPCRMRSHAFGERSRRRAWNAYQSRPLEVMSTDRSLLIRCQGSRKRRRAENLLQIPIEWTKIQKGRNEVRELLGGDGERKPENNWFVRNFMIPIGEEVKFVTHHLWFLYDLVYLVLVFVL